MKPTDILSEDEIAKLWRAGFTIARRQNDPFEIDPKLIPRGMSYQWNDTGRENPGWREVSYARHEGVFGPWGAQGTVEIGNLYLCERPSAEVNLHREAARAAADKLVDDWTKRAEANGITGAVKIGAEERKVGLESAPFVNTNTKTIETTARLPQDMFPHMREVFAERDRLEAEVVRKDRTLAPGPIADKFYAAIDADKGAPWWPTLRSILLPIAIDNVRASLKKETTDE